MISVSSRGQSPHHDVYFLVIRSLPSIQRFIRGLVASRAGHDSLSSSSYSTEDWRREPGRLPRHLAYSCFWENAHTEAVVVGSLCE